jgi:tetratricopeptide (TPR) repeat protein
LFITPSETTWTVFLNKDSKGAGAFEHNPAEDVAKIDVASTSAPPRERLAYLIEDASDGGANLVLDWAGRRIAVALTVNTKEHVDKSIAATLDNAWRPLFNAGRYAFDNGDNARAIELIQQSIGIRATWWNHWWAAQVLAKQNQHQSAREHAERALALGQKDDVFQRAFAEDVNKALASWPKS